MGEGEVEVLAEGEVHPEVEVRREEARGVDLAVDREGSAVVAQEAVVSVEVGAVVLLEGVAEGTKKLREHWLYDGMARGVKEWHGTAVCF